MGHRLVAPFLILALLVIVLAGCGPDPKEQYATDASNIVDEWGVIVAKWNAAPGDSGAAADFASLQARAKAIDPPSEMATLHSLLLQAMEAEMKSFEVYALGKKTESAALHAIALDSMEKYRKALQNLGLVK